MAETAFENGWISNFEGLVTLTLDRVILHTVVYHLLSSTYCQIFIELLWDGRTHVQTDVCTYARMDKRTFEIGSIRSTLSRVDLKTNIKNTAVL